MLKYHLDENVRNAVAHGLRLRGIDVTTTNDAGLIGASDEEQLAYALGQGRVIVTHDDDFLRLAGRPVPHAGIAFCPARRASIGRLVQALVRLWRHCSPDEMAGKIEYISARG